MDRLVFLTLLACCIAGCGTTPDQRAQPLQRVGNDRDAHGCIGSAGYAWCAREASCVRPWELAQQMGLPGTAESFEQYCSPASNPASPSTTVASPLHDPSVITKAFYETFVRPDRGPVGQPYFERVAEVLTPALRAALAEQHAYESKCARSTPADMKPHMFDQNPFFFWPDGITSVGDMKVTISGNTANVLVSLGYTTTQWQDTVQLERHEGHWRISDIQWQEGGSLSARLRDFMATPCDG